LHHEIESNNVKFLNRKPVADESRGTDGRNILASDESQQSQKTPDSVGPPETQNHDGFQRQNFHIYAGLEFE